MASSCSTKLNPLVSAGGTTYQYFSTASQQTTNTNTVITSKSADKTSVIVSDTIVYTINITNNSAVTVSNLFFIDTIPTGTSFITNSFTVVGYGPIPGANPNYGVDLTTVVGALAPSASCAITFIVQLNELPCPRQISNTSNVYYTY